MSRTSPTWPAVVASVRQVLCDMETLMGKPLDERVLDLLALGPASTLGLARMLRVRQGDVRMVLRLLAEAGRIEREAHVADKGRWRLKGDPRPPQNDERPA